MALALLIALSTERSKETRGLNFRSNPSRADEVRALYLAFRPSPYRNNKVRRHHPVRVRGSAQNFFDAMAALAPVPRSYWLSLNQNDGRGRLFFK